MAELTQRSQYNPVLMRLFLTYKCVYQCAHCLMYGSPTNNEVMPEKDIAKYLELGRQVGIPFVDFTGGEPFTVPERLFFAMEKARELGYKMSVESAFLGKTESEIAENARKLSEFTDCYASSIHVYQSRSCPSDFDYVQNKITSIRHLINNGIDVSLIVIDVEEAEETKALFDRIMFDGLGARLIHHQAYGLVSYPYIFVISKDSGDNASIGWQFQKIMKIGRAYDLRLKQRKHHKEELMQSGGILTCRQYDEGEGTDQLLIHPDGRVHICCQHQQNVDFGFGNLKTGDYETVKEKIETHPFMNSGIDAKLGQIQLLIEREFPNLVPNNGFSNGCDVCNLYYRRKELRHKVKEKLGIESGLEEIVGHS